MKKLSDFSIIGRIINTRGIKGELKVQPVNEDLERFYNLESVFVGENLEEFEILKISDNNRFIFMSFRGYENINDVLHLKDENIYVHDTKRVELKENQFFVNDIIGSKVVNTENIVLGIITDIIENPANDVYVLEDENSIQSFIPAVKAFIKKVDTKNKVIVVDPIEGMIN